MVRILLVLLFTSSLGSSQVLSQSSWIHTSVEEGQLGFQTNLSDSDVPSLRSARAAVTDVPAVTPGVKPEGNLVCYSCKIDFRKKQYQWDHPCLGRHSNFKVSDSYLVNCGPNDTLCRVERTEVNGVLIMLKRECTDVCYHSCRPKGFGIKYELCEECCGTDGCNDIYPASRVAVVVPSSSCWVTLLLGWWTVVLAGPLTLP